MIKFTVIMPTYNQATFIRHAINSLFRQTYHDWELIIVDDGCTDNTKEFIADLVKDDRIKYLKNDTNEGLGYSINRALDIAKYKYITYLPSDDYYYEKHLQYLKDGYEKYPEAKLVYTNMTSGVLDSLIRMDNTIVNGLAVNYGLQLIQASHILTSDRWIERKEWVSENLYKTFWHKLITKGEIRFIDKVSCHWLTHPKQRHKIICEDFGGHINSYRQYYNVKNPIRMKVSDMKTIDEEENYRNYHKVYNSSNNGLKILLVGELSYNPERIYALEQAGHKLYGLWSSPLYSFSNVGPLPFGNVEDLDRDDWKNEIRRIKPDIIYGLLNYSAVPLAYEVLMNFPEIPYVWHFKEGPFLCQVHETWKELITLYTKADGVIYLNEELRRWYQLYVPQHKLSMIFDGDLPKVDYFRDSFNPKLSTEDGEVHTVVAGRMIGLTADDIKDLADNHIHIHLYNESYEGVKLQKIRHFINIAHGYFHVHKHCDPQNWTEEFSKFDIGWMHCFDSHNYGELYKCSWNDLNMPARLNTLMAAGIPSIQKDNTEHIVGMQSIVKKYDCGVFYKNIKDLANQLHDKRRLDELTNNTMKCRLQFAFDTYVPELIEFFNKTIKLKKNELRK